MRKALETAYIRLDDDLSKEALPNPGSVVNMKTLSVAMSGSVSCVAHIDGPHLHVAHNGDCNAVLGSFTKIALKTNLRLLFRCFERHQFLDCK